MRTARATKAAQRTQKATDLLKRQRQEVKGLFRSVEGARERRRLLERIGQA
jgi:hypothetical protein